MGAINDTRKVLQDFLAPEIREIKARLDALEKRMDDRFDAAEKFSNERFRQIETFSDERFRQTERNAENRHMSVIAKIRGLQNYDELRERLAKLGASKEIVHQ